MRNGWLSNNLDDSAGATILHAMERWSVGRLFAVARCCHQGELPAGGMRFALNSYGKLFSPIPAGDFGGYSWIWE